MKVESPADRFVGAKRNMAALASRGHATDADVIETPVTSANSEIGQVARQRRSFVIMSGYHDYRSKRKANLHFIADELKQRGDVSFVSLRYSYLTRYREDPRHDLWDRANRSESFDGVDCYLWRTLIHPFRLPKRLALLEKAVFAAFAGHLPKPMRALIEQADIVFAESGISLIYIPLIRRLNPRAQIIYMASDSLDTIHQAGPIKRAMAGNAPSIESARVPSPYLATEIPSAIKCYYIPHGIDKNEFGNIGPSPFLPGSRNAVSVGSMLFDPGFFEIAGKLFPEVMFHVIGSGYSAPIADNVRLYPQMPFAQTLPFLKHCDFAIAPYGPGVAPYLTHTSMKLMQYNYLGVPAVCPESIVGQGLGRFGYRGNDPVSIRHAIEQALAVARIVPIRHLSWAEVTDRLLKPNDYPDTRIVEDQSRDPASKKVIIFRKDLLPISETFILDQFQSYQEWQPCLVGYRFYRGLDISGIAAFTLASQVRWPFSPLYLKAFQHLQYLGISSSRLQGYIQQSGAKLIHAHFGYDAILVYDIARALKIPLVVTLHGTDILSSPAVWQSGSEGFFFRRYPKKLEALFKDDQVFFIAVSDALRREALRRGVPEERCVVRYTGADPRYFDRPDATQSRLNKVLFVGRLVEFKGCEYLLRAMQMVRQQIPDAELVVIGEGPEKAKLVSLSNDLKLGTQFMGAMSRAEVRAWMKRCRVFCLPSITDRNGAFEAFGMVILEAQLSGLPVVTSARGGAEAIIHNETGFVFAEKDTQELATRIKQLLLDARTWQKFSIEGYQHALANFTLDACTPRIEQYYDEILDRNRAHEPRTPTMDAAE